jgi:NAD(P)-dependent dehydrogenase (short-subunit alcohol dehydrogenase family)
MSELLENKNAINYGAAGGIGREVARAFARGGATVFLAGRTRETPDGVPALWTAGVFHGEHMAKLSTLGRGPTVSSSPTPRYSWPPSAAAGSRRRS